MHDSSMLNKNKAKKNRKLVGHWLYIISFVLFMGFSARLIYIVQIGVIAGVSLSERIEHLYYRSRPIETKRGSIFDRQGSVIAQDVLSYTVRAILSEDYIDNGRPMYLGRENFEETATILSEYLPISNDQVLTILTNGVNQTEPPAYQVEFGSVGSGLSVTIRNQIQSALDAAGINGIYFDARTSRSYPNGIFSSHLIGTTSDDEEIRVGVSGLEYVMNDFLSNQNGRESFQVNASGNPVPATNQTVEEGIDGQDVWTTLDAHLQLFTEALMDEVLEETRPENLTALLMDAKTGEILTMAQRPTFHPETQEGIDDAHFIWRNLFTEEMYEPGSTLKLVTVATAIDEGVFDPTERYNPVSMQIEDRLISDHDSGSNGELTMRQALAWSSNTGMVRLQQRIGGEIWAQYLADFGLGKVTGSELFGEVPGILPSRNRVDQAMSSYGHAIGVNQMQMMQLFSAFANGGEMIRPQLIRQVGEETQVFPEVVSQPISQTAADAVLEYMTDVVTDERYGTAYDVYQLTNHEISVKTGTAQIANENGQGYLTGEFDYIYSAVSIYPTDDPQFILYLTIKRPEKYDRHTLAKIANPLMERSMALQSFRD
ncbi:cell division protein FtsI / penicillin-binding protein 2 [Enterococcus innesii]|uniref:Cell division protein FtsI / penicillin-binding protein 2 n=1 Tax=Enterococcus innesii TaxID=2839759 RepID=A0ABM7XWT5_9ENTE|nr:penicillin-binding transpeptidase domain-containing protein [Enterococcus innesii]BDG69629.1 cell division protein FtsI / penicillin-binding protein 2 [Enterococcus innesii]